MNGKYDFKAARQRQDYLIALYRFQKSMMNPELEDELVSQIEEIETEIAEAHLTVKSKMTVLADGHAVIQLENVYYPSLAYWGNGVKGATMQNASN